MQPLEKLSAAAARLVQEADTLNGGNLSIRLREIAAAIRGAVATIRRALEGEKNPSERPLRPKLILGDEEAKQRGK